MASRSTQTGADNSKRLGAAAAWPLVRAVIDCHPGSNPEPLWREWREGVDLDRLCMEEMQLIPVLRGRLEDWLSGDPAAGLLRGIVRRAWTETQLRLSVLRSVISALEEAGCGPVMVAGSPAICLLNANKDSIRPIQDLRVVVRRSQLERAASMIQSLGWIESAPSTLPSPGSLDWTAAAHFFRQDVGLWLQWRILPVPASQAAACEEEFSGHWRSVDCQGVPVRVQSPEHALIAALCGRFECDFDHIPWEVDAALLPFDRIDWDRWRNLAEAFAPQAFERLERMRELGLPAPPVLPSLGFRLRSLLRPGIAILRRGRRQAGRLFRRYVPAGRFL